MRSMLLSLLLAALAAPAARVSAQVVPFECACNQFFSDFSADTVVGTLTASGSCNVVSLSPGTSSCQVQGTLTLCYQPDPNFVFSSAFWADPVTSFTPVTGTCPNNSFTHPSNAVRDCNGGAISSIVSITGAYFGNPHFFVRGTRWYCQPGG